MKFPHLALPSSIPHLTVPVCQAVGREKGLGLGQILWPTSKHTINKWLGFQCISIGDTLAAESDGKSYMSQKAQEGCEK